MKTITTIAATTLFIAGAAVANPEFNNHENYGTVLNDSGATSGGAYEPTGHLVGVADSSDSYGSVLYDLDRSSPSALGQQPSIGDGADDFGSILYDTGSVY